MEKMLLLIIYGKGATKELTSKINSLDPNSLKRYWKVVQLINK